MFRIAGAKRRLVTVASRRVVNSVNAPSTPLRRYASQAGKAEGSSNRLPIAAGLALVGVSGVYLLSKPRKTFTKGSEHGDDAPAIDDAAAGDVTSPVKVYSYEEANQKIRENAQSFKFQAKDGQGRVDVVKLQSNTRVEDEWAVGLGDGVGGQKTLYAGVYDGHAGWATSAVLRKTLIPTVSSALAPLASSVPGDAIDTAIKKAFERLDNEIMEKGKSAADSASEDGTAEAIAALAPAIAGSCALLTIYDIPSSTLRTAVTGDSRAVLGSWSKEKKKYVLDAISKDQTGFNENEVKRLDEEHPGEKDNILNAKSGRLIGLAVTRAFGDHRWKWPSEFTTSVRDRFYGYSPRPHTTTPPYLTARPEVTTRSVQSEDFVIMASDGLWDVISSEDAVECVSQWLTARKAGKAQAVKPAKAVFKSNGTNESTQKCTPKNFAIEDLDNAAVCLIKNALGGNRREMFRGLVTTYAPLSRYARDDITIQVIFFRDPYGKK